jgi:predicted dehydrogenase
VHVYSDGAWASGYLDATPGPDHLRVTVLRQVAVVPADQQYFVRRANVAMVVNYLRMLGPRRVLRKVVSRRSESVRNDAWLSVGLGITEHGAAVAFLVPTGPRGAERVLVHQPLCVEISAAPDGPPRHLVAHSDRAVAARLDSELLALAGWNPGEGTDASLSPTAAEAIERLALEADPRDFEALAPMPAPTEVLERQPAARGGDVSEGPAPGFCVFGYGQYAKTQVIANLGASLRLEAVHELDPLQIGPVPEPGDVAWDTSGWPRSDEVIRHAVVASYHHTHAPLAAELLRRGARHVVIEKPIASSTDQLDDLLAAMATHPEARVHVAFQRRHSPFNRLLRAHLGGGPASMSASVYEVPLPARHWYRWPIVGNAVISNGCHWIDHFLFINDYAPVTHLRAERLSTQLLLAIELANGASGTISLRHEGSPRRGVRDLCQFWHDDNTVTIEDLRRYRAERGFGRAIHRTTHPYRALEEMYQEFGRRIANDLPGDPPERIGASATTTIELARLLDRSR